MNQILKIFLLSFVLLSKTVFAQEKPDVAESNLSDLSKVSELAKALTNSGEKDKTEKDKTENNSTANSTLINQAKDGLASVLLNNKINSLMLDDQESGNLERAVDAFKNNQPYTPEGSDSTDVSKNSTEDEKAKAEAERLKQIEEAKNRENEKSYIYLASIIYFSPKDWIVWINERKITSQTNDPKKELYVESIKKDRATILWKLSLSKWRVISGKSEDLAPKTNSDNQIEIHFELKPNQTYILSANKVVEGKALIALLKQKADDKKAKLLDPSPTPATPTP